ncbi:MAG: hypothetical protein WEC59_09120 [Salibacteraceae bacterium]
MAQKALHEPNVDKTATQFSVFPNPSAFTIDFIQIINANGQLIHENYHITKWITY